LQEVTMDRRFEIEQLAYELFVKSGCIHGRAQEHWFQAEAIINQRYDDTVAAVPEKMPDVKKPAATKADTAINVRAAGKPAAKKKTGPAGKIASKVPSKSKKIGSSKKESTL